MANSERVAIAAHLHVALRRKAGRVTDTDWMAVNDEYAREVVRLAREQARATSDAALQELADKLALQLQAAARPQATPAPLVQRVTEHLRAASPPGEDASEAGRYIGGLR